MSMLKIEMHVTGWNDKCAPRKVVNGLAVHLDGVTGRVWAKKDTQR